MIQTERATPTQLRLLTLLRDGQPHRRKELHACLGDELAGNTAISWHLSKMREYLRPQGYNILCVISRTGIVYQMIRLISND